MQDADPVNSPFASTLQQNVVPSLEQCKPFSLSVIKSKVESIASNLMFLIVKDPPTRNWKESLSL